MAGRALILAPPGASVANPDCTDASDEVGLLARVAEALVPKPKPESTEPTLEFAGYRFDLAGHCLKDAAGKEIPLRPAEFSLLRAFVQRSGRCSRAISSYNSPLGATRRLTIAASTCRSLACGARSSRT